MSAHEKAKSDIVRLQFDVRRAQANIIDRLTDECNLNSRKEFFNNAMALMKWAVEESKKGRRIASYDERKDDIEMIALPALNFREDHKEGNEASMSTVKNRPQLESSKGDSRNSGLDAMSHQTELARQTADLLPARLKML